MITIASTTTNRPLIQANVGKTYEEEKAEKH